MFSVLVCGPTSLVFVTRHWGVGVQVRVYGDRVQSFRNHWCIRKSLLKVEKFCFLKRWNAIFFSARTEHVVLYLQHVLDIANSHSWVDSAIYGIQWAYNLAGFSSPTDSPIIHSISRVVKKLIGTRLVNKMEPISPEMIRKLVEDSDVDNLLELMNVCIFLLAFAGFFRIEQECFAWSVETLVFIAVFSP